MIYGLLAPFYDEFNKDIDYSSWADFIEKIFKKHSKIGKPDLVLDLGCGTGSMTLELARRGYDMTGIDYSPEMLDVARERAFEEGIGQNILWLCQDMREFELYGTVGATVCCLDSLNYLLENKDLDKTFSLVHNYSDPDALFIFDMNTPYKFENVYSDNAYVLEDEDDEGRAIYCGWQNFYDKETRVCDFYLSVFSEDEDGSYFRADEQQKERCYTESEIRASLEHAGFELIGIYGDYKFSTPTDTSERWYFVARAKK